LLEKESGITLQTPAITQFCEGVREGNWELVETHIPDLQLQGEALAVK